jgi:hypothetical protein
MAKKISFEEAFAQATNESIKILGNVVSKIVTDYVERKYSVHLSKTSNNPSALDEALDHAIDGGGTIVERRLLNILYEKLGLEPSSYETATGMDPVPFAQKVNEARRRYTEQINS